MRSSSIQNSDSKMKEKEESESINGSEQVNQGIIFDSTKIMVQDM
jgi:hypothetical protein